MKVNKTQFGCFLQTSKSGFRMVAVYMLRGSCLKMVLRMSSSCLYF